MKRNILLLAVLAVILAQPSAIAAGNTFPFPNIMWGLDDGVGDVVVTLPIIQGWNDGDLAWYIPTIGFPPGTRDFIVQPNLDLENRYRFLKLSSAIGNGAGLMYVVLNFQQGPVFSSRPGDIDYSGLWQVVYIKWKFGVTPRTILSDADLPTVDEAYTVFTDTVVDRPIVAIGQLKNPWYPASPGKYRLKQVVDFDPARKMVLISAWLVYGQDPNTKQPQIGVMLIPDVANRALANTLQANYAPALALVDPDNTQSLWVQDWTLPPPLPPFQFPIAEVTDNHFTEGMNGFNHKHNPQFSPVMDFTLLMRTGLPPYVVVNNLTFLQNLIPPIGSGFSFIGSPIRINAPMLLSEDLKDFFSDD